MTSDDFGVTDGMQPAVPKVNFSGLPGDGVVERVMRVAQGANSAWMAEPLDKSIRIIRVETVQAGELGALLAANWNDVVS